MLGIGCQEKLEKKLEGNIIMEKIVASVEILTEKEKKAYLYNNRGKTVKGPLTGVFAVNKQTIKKDYSKSPTIDSAIALYAHGEEKKVTKPIVRGITKKHKPLSREFTMGFGEEKNE
jgi:hypothetical protein